MAGDLLWIEYAHDKAGASDHVSRCGVYLGQNLEEFKEAETPVSFAMAAWRDPQPWKCYNVPANSLIINRTSLQFLLDSTKYGSPDCPDGPVELFLLGESYSSAPTSFMFDR